MTHEEFIQAFCHTAEQREGHMLHRGFTMEGRDLVSRHIPSGFDEVEEWADGRYRAVWKNGALRALISYTEGDIHVARYETYGAYETALAEAARFYREH